MRHDRAPLAALQCVVSGGGSLGGELARETRGRLFVRGRTHDMIVSGGENVGPWELEAVRASHPHVAEAEAAAVGVADRKYGQRLVACVVLRPGLGIYAGALLNRLDGRVARHQMPRDLLIRETLPLTVIGKVDRRFLRCDATSGAF